MATHSRIDLIHHAPRGDGMAARQAPGAAVRRALRESHPERPRKRRLVLSGESTGRFLGPDAPERQDSPPPALSPTPRARVGGGGARLEKNKNRRLTTGVK